MSEPVYQLNLDEEIIAHLPDPEAWLVINAEGIDPVIIEDTEVRAMFVWQRNHLREHGVPATATVLADEFDLDFAEPETQIGDLLDRLRNRYAENEWRGAVEDIIKAQKQTEGSAAFPQLLLQKGRELSTLLTKRGEMYTSRDIDRTINRYHKKVLQGPGASLGFEDLDNYFYGMRGVNFVIAPPKTMKSWIMCKMVAENAIAGNNPWLFSLELPADETDTRIRCLLSDVPFWKYIRNILDESELERWREATDYLHSCGSYTVYKPEAGHRGIDEMVYMARDAGAGAIFIDQLQYVESGEGESIGSLNQTGSYWKVLNRARDLSDDGPICFAHQFNRTAMYSTEMPHVSQAKGSSSIEEVATLAIGMWASRDMRRSYEAQIDTLIARNHEYAAWKMAYDLNHHCTFEIIERIIDDNDE